MEKIQKIATKVFIYASVAFGIFGIIMILTSQEDDDALINKLLFISVFVILPSFALSVAGKYLNGKK